MKPSTSCHVGWPARLNTAFCGIMAMALCLGVPAPASAQGSGNDDLGPTTETPWNPPRPESGNAPWETALRFPGRVVSLPISLAGLITERSLLFVEDNNYIPRVLVVLAAIPRYGVLVGPASLGERTGFGLRAGYSPPFLDDWLLVDVSGSTDKFSRGRVVAGKGLLHVEYQSDWRPEERFYGLGNSSSDDDTSGYALHSERVRVLGSWPAQEPGTRAAPLRLEAWAGARTEITRIGRDDETTPLAVQFPQLGMATLDARQDHFIYGAGVTLDRRSGRPHWGRGFRVKASAQRFDRPIKALALRQGNATGAQFTRYAIEAEGAVSFMRDPRTLRLQVKAVDQEITSGAGRFRVPDLVHLGGGEGLSGFEPQRFHDLDAVVARLSYIFPLEQHFEFDVHVEAGGVYPDLHEHLTLASMKTSYGVALRPRTIFAPLGAIGVDWSKETVRFRFTIGDVE